MYEIICLMIASYFNGVYGHRQDVAESYVLDVIHESQLEWVDPLAVAVNITKESGWRVNALGTKKEIGLTQIKTSDRKKRRRLKGNYLEQVREGVRIMNEKLRMCRGDLEQAFGAYIYGQCKSTRRSRKRYKLYKKYRRLFEERFDGVQ